MSGQKLVEESVRIAYVLERAEGMIRSEIGRDPFRIRNVRESLRAVRDQLDEFRELNDRHSAYCDRNLYRDEDERDVVEHALASVRDKLRTVDVALVAWGDEVIRRAASSLRAVDFQDKDPKKSRGYQFLQRAVKLAGKLDDFRANVVLEALALGWGRNAKYELPQMRDVESRRTHRKALLTRPLSCKVEGVPTVYLQRPRELKQIKRTGTSLVAERFIAEGKAFECEKCGGGMSQRVRRGGQHLLVCGYCGHERGLESRAREYVAVHSLSDTVKAKAELLQNVPATTSWQCNECGAELVSTGAKIVDRCAYCGSGSFVEVEREGGVLRPQAMLRFAADKERASGLLREWVQRQWDVDAGFRDDFEIESVQARYVPYWVFSVNAPGKKPGQLLLSLTDVHACASGQLLQRMPEELRAIEPFEARLVAPFEPAHLVGTSAERFTVDIEQAWQHAQNTARPEMERQLVDSHLSPEQALESADVQFRYLMFPVYFFVLRWQGREYHALMDGAGAGVGLAYPRSEARIAARRTFPVAALSLGAAAVLVVLIAALQLSGAWLSAQRAEDSRIQSEMDVAREKLIQEQRARDEKRRQVEAWRADEEARTWHSGEISTSAPVFPVYRMRLYDTIDPQTDVTLRFRIVVVFSGYHFEARPLLELLNEEETRRALTEAASADMNPVVAGLEGAPFRHPSLRSGIASLAAPLCGVETDELRRLISETRIERLPRESEIEWSDSVRMTARTYSSRLFSAATATLRFSSTEDVPLFCNQAVRLALHSSFVTHIEGRVARGHEYQAPEEVAEDVQSYLLQTLARIDDERSWEDCFVVEEVLIE